ncbi:MAG TPA: LysM domain-containing protein [Pseudomonadales bacterium]
MWKSVPILLATWLAMGAWAQSTSNLDQYLRADHPDAYVVQKGDTLWDISSRFLQKPWQWPELWRANPQIENPHMIYPGDTVRLVYVEGQPALVLERGDAARTYKASPSGDAKLSPKIRSTPLETAIPAINLDAVQGFIVQNRIVASSVLDGAPYVIQGESERLVLGAGDRLYARGALPDSESYSFVRKGELYRDPNTNEILGLEATYIGLGRVVAREGEITTFFVSDSREQVQIGDRVLPTEERKVDSTFFPSAPAEQIDGQVIDVFGGVTQIGQYDVVVLNRGEREGLATGNVLAIYKRGALAQDRIANEAVRLPSERAGLLMVFRVFEKLSYALVLATERPLAVLDEVKNP